MSIHLCVKEEDGTLTVYLLVLYALTHTQNTPNPNNKHNIPPSSLCVHKIIHTQINPIPLNTHMIAYTTVFSSNTYQTNYIHILITNVQIFGKLLILCFQVFKIFTSIFRLGYTSLLTNSCSYSFHDDGVLLVWRRELG